MTDKHSIRCSICLHEDRDKIDHKLKTGECTYLDIAKEYKLNPDTVKRHVKATNLKVCQFTDHKDFLRTVMTRSLNEADKINLSTGVQAAKELDRMVKEEKEVSEDKGLIQRCVEQIGGLSEDKIDCFVARIEESIRNIESVVQVVESTESQPKS